MMMNNSREKASLVFKDTELSLWNDMQKVFSKKLFFFFLLSIRKNFITKEKQ